MRHSLCMQRTLFKNVEVNMFYSEVLYAGLRALHCQWPLFYYVFACRRHSTMSSLSAGYPTRDSIDLPYNKRTFDILSGGHFLHTKNCMLHFSIINHLCVTFSQRHLKEFPKTTHANSTYIYSRCLYI